MFHLQNVSYHLCKKQSLKMSLNKLFSILCFVLAVSFGYVSTEPRCGDSLFFRPNDAYDTNRRVVHSTLASNVRSRNGFYNVSVGDGPGRIFVLGLCIPGTDPVVCSECIQLAFDGLLESCPNQTDSWEWRGDKTLCFVRYSNYSFFNQIQLEPTQALYNSVRFQGNLTTYSRTWDAFMDFMITRVGQSRYVIDKSAQIGSDSIYVLMQCIPGISSEECEACIQASVDMYQSCCNEHIGGTVGKPVCFFRWEGYKYLGAFGDTPSSLPPQLVPLPPSAPDGKTISTGAIVAIVVSVVFSGVLLVSGLVFWKRRHSYKTLKPQTHDDMTTPQSLQFDFTTIQAATDNFSANNKLGEGGFGAVYKGKLADETVIAVKRLSRNSGQGTQEFKNEVVIVAKLQHKNLVRLLGFCVEGDEQILVYEFVPNKSLDYFLFDPTNKSQLDWKRRGYMPPEYMTHGQFSTKSDVYSFGVLILEIVCGKKNSSFYQMDDSGGNLVTHACRLWNNDSPLELLDPAIRDTCEMVEVTRCIHIGLLCVQENPTARPEMSTIFQMLTNSSIVLPVPRPPGFFLRNRSNLDPLTYGYEPGQSSSKSIPCSVDSASITSVTPR
ncbi:hypothetical protein HID58_049523 [Brassica napus]|uniref:Uncharacterized protein n=1 Tax=Brassica napus TaxID=3708 RepID=A0ABQ8B5A7_BRANA|nr:hypothetical protein HID58_049523 [Brassica napus]